MRQPAQVFRAEPPYVSIIAVPLADDKLCKKVLKLAKKAAKKKQIKRGVKEVIKAVRKKQKGCVISTCSFLNPVHMFSDIHQKQLTPVCSAAYDVPCASSALAQPAKLSCMYTATDVPAR